MLKRFRECRKQDESLRDRHILKLKIEMQQKDNLLDRAQLVESTVLGIYLQSFFPFSLFQRLYMHYYIQGLIWTPNLHCILSMLDSSGNVLSIHRFCSISLILLYIQHSDYSVFPTNFLHQIIENGWIILWSAMAYLYLHLVARGRFPSLC